MKHKDFNFSGTGSFLSWESDRGTLASKTGGWQQPLSQSSCSASCRASCETNKSWAAGCTCLKTDKNGRWDRDKEMLTSIKQTISNTRPRSIHASSWAFTRHVHGRQSCTIDIVANVSDVSGCVPHVAATIHWCQVLLAKNAKPRSGERKSRFALFGYVLQPPQTTSH